MDRLKINNFKSFKKETNIDLSSITINVGMNSVGKSTVIQSLLLIRQTFDEINKYKGTHRIYLNILLYFDSFWDLIFRHSNSKTSEQTTL